MKGRVILLFCVIIVIPIVGCYLFSQRKSDEKQTFYKQAMELKLKNLENLKSRLLRKELDEISVILKDSLHTNACNRTIIYYYTGNDCLQCIQKGFRILKNINNSFSKNLIWIISSNTNIYRDQMANDYQEYIFSDENDIIRKKLKNFYSPAFFVLYDNIIERIYFISSNEDICNEDNVIKSIRGVMEKNSQNLEKDER